MMNKIIVVACLIFTSLQVAAQELNCKVVVNAEQVQTTDRRVFKDMEIAFAQFMNTRRWTEDEFQPEEKIDCNLIVTIERMPSIGNFQATVQIQSARPIFNTNYESVLLNFADRQWTFEYIESQPLEYNDNSFITNLTSMLAFYAYTVLGLDYDSFSDLGGEDYFQKALTVVNNAQQSNRPGWDPLQGNRNRYWLSENLTNRQMYSIRRGLYTYHRLALDTYDKDPDNSRKLILNVLKDIQRIRKSFPSSILIISFMDAKTDELINIFSEGNIQVRREAFDVLSEIDPTNATKYDKIVKN
ncbi:MAG: DUF4835 family protein [Bacteroidota bacterium]